MPALKTTDTEIKTWIKDLKSKIQSSQIKAAITVNKELLKLYWELGKSISEKLNQSKWGNAVVEELSKELKNEFPNQKGFSRTNLFSMRKWFEFYKNSEEIEFVQQAVGQIPWGHNVAIISKVKTIEEALFYCNKTLENNWSRAVLLNQLSSNLFYRKGKAITNFRETLPSAQSALALDTLKDPYKLDFLEIHDKISEREIENQLIDNISKFLLELGTGFSYLGKQYPIKLDDKDFYLDLLFYHVKLKCYVVIELKTVEFKAEFAGKLNFYLSAVDDLLKDESDNPTIGLLLCQSKSKLFAEYALRGIQQPIGIAEYELSKAIPKDLEPSLPTIEKIEKELASTFQKGSI